MQSRNHLFVTKTSNQNPEIFSFGSLWKWKIFGHGAAENRKNLERKDKEQYLDVRI